MIEGADQSPKDAIYFRRENIADAKSTVFMDEKAKMLADLDKAMARIDGGLSVFESQVDPTAQSEGESAANQENLNLDGLEIKAGLSQTSAPKVPLPTPTPGASDPELLSFGAEAQGQDESLSDLAATQCFEKDGPPIASPARRITRVPPKVVPAPPARGEAVSSSRSVPSTVDPATALVPASNSKPVVTPPSSIAPAAEKSFDSASILPDEVLRRQMPGNPEETKAAPEQEIDGPPVQASEQKRQVPVNAVASSASKNARRGLFSANLGLNVFAALALATALGIGPAFFWASGYIERNRLSLLDELEQSATSPVRVEKGELRDAKVVRADVLQVSDRAATRFYGLWVLIAIAGTGVFGFPYRRSTSPLLSSKKMASPA